MLVNRLDVRVEQLLRALVPLPPSTKLRETQAISTAPSSRFNGSNYAVGVARWHGSARDCE